MEAPKTTIENPDIDSIKSKEAWLKLDDNQIRIIVENLFSNGSIEGYIGNKKTDKGKEKSQRIENYKRQAIKEIQEYKQHISEQAIEANTILPTPRDIVWRWVLLSPRASRVAEILRQNGRQNGYVKEALISLGSEEYINKGSWGDKEKRKELVEQIKTKLIARMHNEESDFVLKKISREYNLSRLIWESSEQQNKSSQEEFAEQIAGILFRLLTQERCDNCEIENKDIKDIVIAELEQSKVDNYFKKQAQKLTTAEAKNKNDLEKGKFRRMLVRYRQEIIQKLSEFQLDRGEDSLSSEAIKNFVVDYIYYVKGTKNDRKLLEILEMDVRAKIEEDKNTKNAQGTSREDSQTGELEKRKQRQSDNIFGEDIEIVDDDGKPEIHIYKDGIPQLPKPKFKDAKGGTLEKVKQYWRSILNKLQDELTKADFLLRNKLEQVGRSDRFKRAVEGADKKTAEKKKQLQKERSWLSKHWKAFTGGVITGALAVVLAMTSYHHYKSTEQKVIGGEETVISQSQSTQSPEQVKDNSAGEDDSSEKEISNYNQFKKELAKFFKEQSYTGNDFFTYENVTIPEAVKKALVDIMEGNKDIEELSSQEEKFLDRMTEDLLKDYFSQGKDKKNEKYSGVKLTFVVDNESLAVNTIEVMADKDTRDEEELEPQPITSNYDKSSYGKMSDNPYDKKYAPDDEFVSSDFGGHNESGLVKPEKEDDIFKIHYDGPITQLTNIIPLADYSISKFFTDKQRLQIKQNAGMLLVRPGESIVNVLHNFFKVNFIQLTGNQFKDQKIIEKFANQQTKKILDASHSFQLWNNREVDWKKYLQQSLPQKRYILVNLENETISLRGITMDSEGAYNDGRYPIYILN